MSALGLGTGAKLYVSSPGFLPKQLTTAGEKFVTDFTTKYGHAPTTEAILGYEAMAAVLHVLTQAGTKANDRSTVVKDFLALHNVAFVLPTQWSINSATGDTNLGGVRLQPCPGRHARAVRGGHRAGLMGRGRALALALAGTAALTGTGVLAGCGGSSTKTPPGDEIKGTTLTIYSSGPQHGASQRRGGRRSLR